MWEMVEEENAHSSLQLVFIFNLNPGTQPSTKKERERAGLPNTGQSVGCPHSVAFPPFQENSHFLSGLTPARGLWACCNLKSRCLPLIQTQRGLVWPGTWLGCSCVPSCALEPACGTRGRGRAHTPQQLCPDKFLPHHHSHSSDFPCPELCFIHFRAVSPAFQPFHKLFLSTQETPFGLGYPKVHKQFCLLPQQLPHPTTHQI